MGQIGYYLILYPVSLLPLRVLYLFSDIFYCLLITVIPYRKTVIRENLRNSFPHKSSKALRKIERQFYRYFADLMAEAIKNFSISERELRKRFRVANPELMNQLLKKDKSVLLVSGHYNNWEWLITAQNLLFNHKAVGIGMPLSSKFWEKKLNERRSRFGMDIVHSETLIPYFNANKKCIATLILADQSPKDSLKSYWSTFLNQNSAFVFGPEMLANAYNHAVVYFKIERTKRGYYLMHLETITENPLDLEYGEITKRYISKLESAINEAPAYWLWSHKRWKREVPDNLSKLKQTLKEKFENRYRSR